MTLLTLIINDLIELLFESIHPLNTNNHHNPKQTYLRKSHADKTSTYNLNRTSNMESHVHSKSFILRFFFFFPKQSCMIESKQTLNMKTSRFKLMNMANKCRKYFKIKKSRQTTLKTWKRNIIKWKLKILFFFKWTTS